MQSKITNNSQKEKELKELSSTLLPAKIIGIQKPVKRWK